MSGTLQGATYYVTELPTTTRFLLCALADHADDKGLGVWPGNERLALKTGVSVRHIQRMLKDLEADGWIARVAFPAGGRGHAVAWAVNAARIYDTARENGWTQETPAGVEFAPKGDSGVTVSEPHPKPERVTSDARKGDIQRERVTSSAGKGDAGVTPTVREPSVEPSEEPFPALSAGTTVETLAGTSKASAHLAETANDALPARTRQPDPIFETVAAVCFGADDYSGLTSRERGMANRACKELRNVGATPDDIVERARNFVAWVGQRPTPDNLVTHWNRLREPVQRLPRHELEAAAEEQVMAARMRDAQARESRRAAEAAAAASVTSDRQISDGYTPPPKLPELHPRRDGESMRDYVRRLNRAAREAG